MSFVLIGFGAGLQGEEIPMGSLIGLLLFCDETRADPDLFIMITLLENSRVKLDTGGIVAHL